MHQSQLSFAALLSCLHSHSQSELSFDHSVSLLWLYPFCLKGVWLICYQETENLLCVVSNATSRSNSYTSGMAYCECDVSYTFSSYTPGRLPSGALWEGLRGVPWMELPVISKPQQHVWQGSCFCRNVCTCVSLLRSTSACVWMSAVKFICKYMSQCACVCMRYRCIYIVWM